MNLFTKVVPDLLARNGAQVVVIEISPEGLSWEQYDPAKHDKVLLGTGSQWADIRVKGFPANGDPILKKNIEDTLKQVVSIPELKGIDRLLLM